MKRRVPITVVHALSAAHGEVGGNSQAGPYERDHLGKQFFRIAGAAGDTCLLLVTLALTSAPPAGAQRSEEHTSELQSRLHLVCRLLLEKKKKKTRNHETRT